MAIYLRCQKCSSDMSVSSKKCEKCGAAIPKRNKKYKVMVYNKQSKKRIVKMVENLQIAKDIEASIKSKIALGEFDIKRNRPITLDDVWDKYLPWAKQNKDSWKSDESRYLNHLQPEFGNKKLSEISPFHIESLVVKLKKGKNARNVPYSPATIKHILTVLGRLYTVAGQWGLYSGDNPCKKVKKPKLNNQITEYLTDDELQRLMDVLRTWPDRMSVSFILFSLHTGLRRGELFKLQWENVDYARKTMTIKDPKGIIDQILPLSDKAIEILQGIPREYNTPWVFYGKDGEQRVTFQKPWYRIRKAAELPKDFRLHGLRHHFASTLVSNGVDLYTVQKLLCHKDASTTMRYAHLADRTLRDAVNLSDSLLTPKKTSNVVSISEVRDGTK